MTEGRGVKIISIEERLKAASPDKWVTDVRLGWTADKARVVDYYSTEAAYLFRAAGKPVTVEESERFGISPEHPFSPRPPVKFVPPPPDPDEEEGKGPTVVKQANQPEDKAITKAEVEDKGVRRFGKRSR